MHHENLPAAGAHGRIQVDLVQAQLYVLSKREVLSLNLNIDAVFKT